MAFSAIKLKYVFHKLKKERLEILFKIIYSPKQEINTSVNASFLISKYSSCVQISSLVIGHLSKTLKKENLL